MDIFGFYYAHRTKVLTASGFIAVSIAFGIYGVSRAPASRTVDTTITVAKNISLTRLASDLQTLGIIRSAFVFKVYVVLASKHHTVVAGDYLIKPDSNAWSIARRIARGQYGISPIRVTFPEGLTSMQIGAQLGSKIPGFASTTFMAIAKEYEGYLFPDTYLFMPNVTPQDVLSAMTANFDQLTASFKLDLQANHRTLHDVVTMASILEEEANTPESKAIVAGILWKRIDKGIPLQVDSPFVYVIGKGSNQLSYADLKIDSPYNTYTNKGLPKGPISNPGLVSLRAALNPIETPYYFFLSDSKGVLHYARTAAEHIANRVKYLRK